MWCARRRNGAFALYEVLLGLSIFVIGVLMLGKSIQNCLRANTLSAEDDRVRQILANRMAEIQATPGVPDERKETKIDIGYGNMRLIQQTVPANLKNEKDLELNGINKVTLSVEWMSGGHTQTKKIAFYVYRIG
jgi:Tfp pilus assembly protein PilV